MAERQPRRRRPLVELLLRGLTMRIFDVLEPLTRGNDHPRWRDREGRLGGDSNSDSPLDSPRRGLDGI